MRKNFLTKWVKSMDLKYKVIISESTQKDIDSIFEYIYFTLNSPKAADRISSNIAKAILNLRVFPKQCPLADKTATDGSPYRKLIVENYIIYYLLYENDEMVRYYIYYCCRKGCSRADMGQA